MIEIVLRDVNVDAKPVEFAPLSISRPETWPSLLLPDTVAFVRVSNAWEEEKARRFVEAGFGVYPIRPEILAWAALNASKVRELISLNGSWETLVPSSILPYLNECLVPRLALN